MAYYVLPALWGTTYSTLVATSAAGGTIGGVSASTILAINAGIAGSVGGYISTGTLKGAVIGGLTALAFYRVGDMKLGWAESAVAHGGVGCASSAAGGGKCSAGFLAAGFSDLANFDLKSLPANVALRATTGGIGSVLGGGKFENGAVTGAFAYAAGRALEPGKQAVAAAKGKRPQGVKVDGPENMFVVPDNYRDALANTLGTTRSEIDGIIVYEYSETAKLVDQSNRIAGGPGILAVTAKNAIYFRYSGTSFLADLELVLHEYYHVVHQWNNDRLTVARYVAAGTNHATNKWEVEAMNFARNNYSNFKQQLHPGIGP